MWDFSISRSLGLMGKTMPFILLRAVVYFGMAAAYVIATGTGAGIGWGVYVRQERRQRCTETDR